MIVMTQLTTARLLGHTVGVPLSVSEMSNTRQTPVNGLTQYDEDGPWLMVATVTAKMSAVRGVHAT